MSKLRRRLVPLILVTLAGLMSPWVRGLAQDVPAMIETLNLRPGSTSPPSEAAATPASGVSTAPGAPPVSDPSLAKITSSADASAADAKVAPVRRQRPKLAQPSPWMVAALANLKSKAKPSGLGAPLVVGARPECAANTKTSCAVKVERKPADKLKSPAKQN